VRHDHARAVAADYGGETDVKPALLIVDDDEDIRSQMKWGLAQDYEVLIAENRPDALVILRERQPRVVLLDLGLPPHPGDPQEGFAALSEILAHDRLIKVVIISGQSDKAYALKAIGEGAFDFLAKPLELTELKLILKRAFYVTQLEREYREAQRQLDTATFEGMLGTSSPMQEVFNGIRKVATTDAAVLILGESGTGKEMAAMAIHRRSARKDGPFVAINCGAIPETLLESELFGHEKGAFTGAHAQRKGRIETAAGGTLFLDEIGEMPLQLQVKLLRFLQEKRLERVGGRTQIEVDARVIVATNRDLKAEMENGRFREDLFYRIAVVVLRMPALRQRAGDLQLLAQAFLKRFASENGSEPPKFNDEAIRAIEAHGWPGNVRELENRVKRALIMAEGRRISAADLELSNETQAPAGRTLKEAREAVERELVERSLRRHRGTITRAAEELGISRPTLYELIDKLRIKNE